MRPELVEAMTQEPPDDHGRLEARKGWQPATFVPQPAEAEPWAAFSEPPSSPPVPPIEKTSERDPAPAAPPETEYIPSEAEAGIAADILEYRKRVPVTYIEIDQEKLTLKIEHPDTTVGTAAIMAALGTRELAFLDGLVRQVGNAAAGDVIGMEFMLAIMMGMEPRDHVEAMLATQMAAIHTASMTMARRLAQAKTLQQQDSAERAFNKLARTFAAQTEALKRYRTGGEQKITVQHVTVNDGGQAVVGSVTTGGGEEKRSER